MDKELDEALKMADRWENQESELRIAPAEKALRAVLSLAAAYRSSLSTIRAQEEEIAGLRKWLDRELDDALGSDCCESRRIAQRAVDAESSLAAMTKERDEATGAWSRAEDMVLKLTNVSIRKSGDVLALEASLAAEREKVALEHENFLAVHRDNMALVLRVAALEKDLGRAREALRSYADRCDGEPRKHKPILGSNQLYSECIGCLAKETLAAPEAP